MRYRSFRFLVLFAALLAVHLGNAPGAWAQAGFNSNVTALPPAPAAPIAAAPTMALPVASPLVSSVAINAKDYQLGVGDHIRLNVYGEDDLSGEYEIGGNGMVPLPLVGSITAAGVTAGQLEDTVRLKLAQGYLHDPKVSVQILNYRPFFILGEVSKPGSYPYVNGMTVLNAVALAGGYTYRASSGRIKIVHHGDPDKIERSAEESDAVLPGDIIRVPERYF